MRVDLNKFNRCNLSEDQKNALIILAPLSLLISDWIIAKCRFLQKPGKIYRSIILADLLIESEFMTHPISKEFIGTKCSNNITRIKADNEWRGRVLEYEKEGFRSYRDSSHFASDYTDIICFTDKYDEVLTETRHRQQLSKFSTFKPNPKLYNSKSETIIEFYGLGEFDG